MMTHHLSWSWGVLSTTRETKKHMAHKTSVHAPVLIGPGKAPSLFAILHAAEELAVTV
jgi:hypothetical protein